MVLIVARACVHDCNTRYKNNLNISAYKSASGQRTFLYRAMSFWNSLPCEIRECDSLPIFKRHLKEFLSSVQLAIRYFLTSIGIFRSLIFNVFSIDYN